LFTGYKRLAKGGQEGFDGEFWLGLMDWLRGLIDWLLERSGSYCLGGL
jgi:hypothetical protein